MRKPVYAVCEQQRRRSACASAQSDQRLCCSLPRSHDTSSFYTRNFKPLLSFCGCAGWFESTLVADPEDRFSRDEAQMSGNQISVREEWNGTALRTSLRYVVSIADVASPSFESAAVILGTDQ